MLRFFFYKTIRSTEKISLFMNGERNFELLVKSAILNRNFGRIMNIHLPWTVV